MEISTNARERIFAAADALYVEAERRVPPTVDSVRKRALVNMNDACTGMKEWRRLQTATLDQIPHQMPVQLTVSCTAALAALWKEATTMANESLRAAQAGWDTDQSELNDLLRQMALAYDLQASDLEVANGDISKLQSEAATTFRDMTAAKAALNAANEARVTAFNDAKVAHVRALETGCRAEALRGELERAHEECIRAREETAFCRAAHAEQIEQLRIQARRDVDQERERAAVRKLGQMKQFGWRCTRWLSYAAEWPRSRRPPHHVESECRGRGLRMC